MTAYCMWNLCCEGDGDHGDHGICMASLDDATGRNATEARGIAKEEGWTRVKRDGEMVDLCPFCSTLPKKKTDSRLTPRSDCEKVSS